MTKAATQTATKPKRSRRKPEATPKNGILPLNLTDSELSLTFFDEAGTFENIRMIALQHSSRGDPWEHTIEHLRAALDASASLRKCEVMALGFPPDRAEIIAEIYRRRAANLAADYLTETRQ